MSDKPETEPVYPPPGGNTTGSPYPPPPPTVPAFKPVTMDELLEVRKLCLPTGDGSGNVILTEEALNRLLWLRSK